MEYVLFVVEEDGEITGVFAYMGGRDETYAYIEDGAWLSDDEYKTIHRVAASKIYQGEKYILENNECVPICESAQDETGRREWDENSKRCVHTCNDGWIAW